MNDLKQTPLNALHVDAGGKMVAFAGYSLPVQYPLGVMKEHLHTRAAAGLFDVSHMGQLLLRAPGGYDEVASKLEALIPADLCGLGLMRQRYGLLTSESGGIRDDLMVVNRGDHAYMVVNAACKTEDLAHLRASLSGVEIVESDRALLALQGPKAEAALQSLISGPEAMRFMQHGIYESRFGEVWVSRSGYSGEDGFEISVEAHQAEVLARALLKDENVQLIGLGARDSLRLEAGLCLYGNDIDLETSPIEASLTWSIQKLRREGGERAGGFLGSERIFRDAREGTAQKRVGFRPEGKAPMRAGTLLFSDQDSSEPIGRITSGCFGPSINAPVAMGYVDIKYAAAGTMIFGEVRGKRLPVQTSTLPFLPANFKR